MLPVSVAGMIRTHLSDASSPPDFLGTFVCHVHAVDMHQFSAF
jgi:hypothetical protein